MVAVLTRHRLYALAAALAVLAGGCGDSADDGAPPGGVGAGLTTTTEAGDAPATTQGGAGGASSKPPSTRGPGGGLPTGGSGSPTNADSGDLRAAARQAPGAFAGMLLAPGPADTLVLDVLVEQGVSADAAAVAALRSLLGELSGKPVSVRGPSTISAPGDVHSADQIRSLADSAGRAQGNGTGVIYVLYLGGAFTDDGALGVAVRGDTFALFPDQMAQAASPLVSRARIERAVVTHELGHVLGLVDLYLDKNRDDREHPGHSSNPRSVMYWAVESDLVGQVLGGPPPVDFDDADRADLKEIRAGAAPE